MRAALVPAKDSIIERVNASPRVTMDETGWRVEGFSSWLRVASTEGVTAYNVADGRGFDQACDLVRADYDGVIIRDDWGPYHRYRQATHQSCCAHLLRRASEMAVDLPDWARATPPARSRNCSAMLSTPETPIPPNGPRWPNTSRR